MTYTMMLLLVGLVLGLVSVASNPSPYFGALGLVGAAGVGCGLLVGYGGSFLSLVLFLIYLGGMLIVFAYTAALAAEPFPESLGSWIVKLLAAAYMTMLLAVIWLVQEDWYEFSWVPCDELNEFSMFRGDAQGTAFLYSFGYGFLIIGVWVLLLTLFVVLELTRGLSRGSLRAV